MLQQVRKHINLAKPFVRRTRPGAVPGSIQNLPDATPPEIRVIHYNSEDYSDEILDSPDRIADFLEKPGITWVNVNGVGHAKTIQQVAAVFKLHVLAIEDVVNVHQRAKLESYPDHLFLVIRIPSQNAPSNYEQVSLFIGQGYLLTFQEVPGDCWDPVRTRLRKDRGQIREQGADYLTYALVDAGLDAYFPILENIGQQVEELEEHVLIHPNSHLIRQIHSVRRELLLLRRTLWPHREAVNALLRDYHPLIESGTRVFLRDCYDHTVQLIEVGELYREMCSDLRDFHFSQVSTRTNEVMKILTIIATIFIPLGFIAGVYGMNFDPK
ncbi:MAG: magnesium/cobalt transporter CorA, partial [Planctomycetaceae bacterium]|nr:magnesium/cobalt transporter CorA [Planctomycetaceae bacterium]